MEQFKFFLGGLNKFMTNGQTDSPRYLTINGFNTFFLHLTRFLRRILLIRCRYYIQACPEGGCQGGFQPPFQRQTSTTTKNYNTK